MSLFAWLTTTHFVLLIFLCARQWFHVNSEGTQSQNTLILRWSENLPLGLFNRGLSLAVGAWIGVIPAVKWADSWNWHLFGKNPVIGFMLFLFVMDLFFYFRHRIFHHVLWNLHRLHHEDEAFDATLSLRFHPVEIVINIAIYGAGTFLCGANEIQAALVSQIFAFQALFSHIDTKPTNKKVWQIQDRIFILPWNHKTHHERHRPHCNFGFLFSFWDRIFGTWQKRSSEPARIGVMKIGYPPID